MVYTLQSELDLIIQMLGKKSNTWGQFQVDNKSLETKKLEEQSFRN